VAADVIAIRELVDLGLVKAGVSLQASDAFFYGAAESRANLKSIVDGAIRNHVRLLSLRFLRCENFFRKELKFFRKGLKFFSLGPMVATGKTARQITTK
jgi:hypothetical protein